MSDGVIVPIYQAQTPYFPGKRARSEGLYPFKLFIHAAKVLHEGPASLIPCLQCTVRPLDTCGSRAGGCVSLSARSLVLRGQRVETPLFCGLLQDALQEMYNQEGVFPGEQFKPARRPWTLLNFLFWATVLLSPLFSFALGVFASGSPLLILTFLGFVGAGKERTITQLEVGPRGVLESGIQPEPLRPRRAGPGHSVVEAICSVVTG